MRGKGDDGGDGSLGTDHERGRKQIQEDEPEQAIGKFAHYRHNSAQLLANRLKARGYLYTAEMTALIRENIADPWPQELVEYVAGRLEGSIKGTQGRGKTLDGAENRFWINISYKELLPVLQGKPSDMDEETKATLLEMKQREFPDDPPHLAAEKILARGFLGSETMHRRIRELARSKKP